MILDRFFDWIGRNSRFIILTPFISAIGNCAENIYFGLLKARRKGKRLIILYPYELPWKFRFSITNRELLEIDSPWRGFSGSIIFKNIFRIALTSFYGPLRIFSRCLDKITGKPLHGVYVSPSVGLTTLWQPRENMENFSWEIVDSYRWTEQLQEYLPVHLREDRLRRAREVRRSMGIPDEAWFACLHVREGGFHSDFKEAACRNASIANYISGIKAITDAGGWVIRIGDKTMTPLPSMERVIDYPRTSFKSDLMDIYFIQECRFYVGTQSGPMDVALLFQKPHLMTNMQSWLYPFPQRKRDRGLLKHVFSKKRGRFLTVRELLDEPWEAQHFHSLGEDYVMHENSPEEILDLIREFLEQMPEIGLPKISNPQEEFNRKRISRGREILSSPLFPNHFDDMHNRYRIASRLESSLGSLGGKFLERHWNRPAARV